MSFTLANAVRTVSRSLPAFSTRSSLGLVSKPANRSLWYMSHPSNQFLPKKLSSTFNQHNGSCPCGTACRGVHTRGMNETEPLFESVILTIDFCRWQGADWIPCRRNCRREEDGQQEEVGLQLGRIWCWAQRRRDSSLQKVQWWTVSDIQIVYDIQNFILF